MSFSNYLEAAILDHVFNKSAFTALSSIFVALSTADPGEDGSTINEPSTGDYARLEIATADMTRSGGGVSNDNEEEFNTSTAAWASGTELTHVALFDAATGGNLLGSAALDAGRTVDASGIILRFSAGELMVSLD